MADERSPARRHLRVVRDTEPPEDPAPAEEVPPRPPPTAATASRLPERAPDTSPQRPRAGPGVPPAAAPPVPQPGAPPVPQPGAPPVAQPGAPAEPGLAPRQAPPSVPHVPPPPVPGSGARHDADRAAAAESDARAARRWSTTRWLLLGVWVGVAVLLALTVSESVLRTLFGVIGGSPALAALGGWLLWVGPLLLNALYGATLRSRPQARKRRWLALLVVAAAWLPAAITLPLLPNGNVGTLTELADEHGSPVADAFVIGSLAEALVVLVMWMGVFVPLASEAYLRRLTGSADSPGVAAFSQRMVLVLLGMSALALAVALVGVAAQGG